MQQQVTPRPVAITGLGTINALGNSVAETWQMVAVGRSGIGPITRFDAAEYKTQFGGEVKNFNAKARFGRRDARRLDPAIQYALAAAEEAVRDAGLDQWSDEQRAAVGVVMGNGIGGLTTTEENVRTLVERGPARVSPFFIPMMLPDSIPAQVSMAYGFQGTNLSIATACASATNAIGEAARMIAYGFADVMVTGGAEVGVVPVGVAGFNNMGAMSTWNDRPQAASRPFDAERNGFVPADGAAVLVLEPLETAVARGAHVYGLVAGYGSTADAYHISAPREDGSGAVASMRAALQSADMTPDAIDYINAHGTSTPLNDEMETTAVKTVFGERAYDVPMSSTKSMHGHVLGAAGAIEVVISLQAMAHSLLPPTINYEHRDPACDLDYVPNEARAAQIDTVMSNSFGFGGHNATLILRRP